MARQGTVFVVLVALLFTPVTGVAVADVETVDDETIRIEQEYRQHDDPGVVAVTFTYHVGTDFTDFRTRLSGDVAVADTNGLSVERDDGARWLDWDGATERPTATLHVRVNETSDRFGGDTGYDAGDWALFPALGFYTRYTWSERGVDPSLTRTRDVAGEGIAGTDLVYLGPSEQYTRTVDNETIRLVVPAAADVNDSQERLDALAYGARRLDTRVDIGDGDSGTHGVEVTAFAAPPPLRIGQAFGSDFFARDNASVATWLHEYAHTRQSYHTANGTRWTEEAFAEYYGVVLAWQYADSYGYHEVQSLFARGRADGSVLSRPSTWSGTTDYDRGATVLAALDARIRNETEGSATLQDVFRRLNDRSGTLRNGSVRTDSAAVTGASLNGFFSEYVYGRQPPSTAGYLVARGVQSDLSVTTTARNGSQGEISVTIRNTGPDVAAAPEIAVDSPGARIVTVDGYRASNRSIPLSDLAPNESTTVPVRLYPPGGERVTESVAIAVTSASNDRAAASVPIAYGERTPTVTPTPAATATESPPATTADRPPTGTPTASDAAADGEDEILAGLGIIVGLGIAVTGGLALVVNTLLGLVWRSVVSNRTLAVPIAGGVVLALASVAVAVF